VYVCVCACMHVCVVCVWGGDARRVINRPRGP